MLFFLIEVAFATVLDIQLLVLPNVVAAEQQRSHCTVQSVSERGLGTGLPRITKRPTWRTRLTIRGMIEGHKVRYFAEDTQGRKLTRLKNLIFA